MLIDCSAEKIETTQGQHFLSIEKELHARARREISRLQNRFIDTKSNGT